MLQRRELLLALLGGAAWPAARASAPSTRLGLAWRGPRAGDTHHVGLLEADWAQRRLRIVAAVPVPSRPHGLLAEEGGGFVAVALRPGRWLMRLDRAGRVTTRIDIADEPLPRRFDGHAIASADGRWLYTTETDTTTGAGRLGVRDAATFRKRDDWATHGLEPHQLLPQGDGAIVIANGGIRRGPDDRKLDLDRMDPSLVRLDPSDGTLLGRWTLPDRRLSIRHLAWAGDGLLGLALQAEHASEAERRAAPALAVWDGERLVTPPGGEGYAGDIAGAPGGGFVLTHAVRDTAWWWHPARPERLTEVARLQQAYALAGRSGAAPVLIAAALGLARWHPAEPGAMLPWPGPMAPDNHMVQLNDA